MFSLTDYHDQEGHKPAYFRCSRIISVNLCKLSAAHSKLFYGMLTVLKKQLKGHVISIRLQCNTVMDIFRLHLLTFQTMNILGTIESIIDISSVKCYPSIIQHFLMALGQGASESNDEMFPSKTTTRCQSRCIRILYRMLSIITYQVWCRLTN